MRTVRCTVTIDRVHPNAKDPSVSGWGHERGARFWSTDTDRTTVDAWIAQNAPEVDRINRKVNVTNFGEVNTHVPGCENRDYYFLGGIDPRGYRTEVYVQFIYPETVKVLHAGTVQQLITGESITLDRTLISY